METTLISFALLLCLLVAANLYVSLKKSSDGATDKLLQQLQQALQNNKEEYGKIMRDNRIELSQRMEGLGELLAKKAKEDREELRQTLKDFQEVFSKNVAAFNELQKERQLCPSVVMLSGSVMFVSEVQLLKQLLPTLVTPFSIVTVLIASLYGFNG